jgi:hypothetical protein
MRGMFPRDVPRRIAWNVLAEAGEVFHALAMDLATQLLTGMHGRQGAG